MGLRVIIAQINSLVGDVQGNSKRIIDIINNISNEKKADLIVFPELAVTGYLPEDLLLRSEFLECVQDAVNTIYSASTEIVTVIGYPSRRENALYNTAGVFSKGKIIAEYDKMLLPNYSVFDEKRYFKAGRCPCVINIAGIQIGITICEDIWYGEPVNKAIAAGAKLILNLNASPFYDGKSLEREQLLIQRAKSMKLPIIYTNLVGGQDELVFDGASFAVDAYGKIIMRAASFKEDQAVIEFDNMIIPQKNVDIKPHNSRESAIYKALILGVHDYVNKNGFQDVILGLSGGIDSALTLAIAVDALGANHVEP